MLYSPICRGRVWRSEIEVSLDEGDGYARGLERRQKKRQPCQCPPEDHILDLSVVCLIICVQYASNS